MVVANGWVENRLSKNSHNSTHPYLSGLKIRFINGLGKIDPFYIGVMKTSVVRFYTLPNMNLSIIFVNSETLIINVF